MKSLSAAFLGGMAAAYGSKKSLAAICCGAETPVDGSRSALLYEHKEVQEPIYQYLWSFSNSDTHFFLSCLKIYVQSKEIEKKQQHYTI